MKVWSTLHFYLTLFDQHDTHFTLKVLAFPAALSYFGELHDDPSDIRCPFSDSEENYRFQCCNHKPRFTLLSLFFSLLYSSLTAIIFCRMAFHWKALESSKSWIIHVKLNESELQLRMICFKWRMRLKFYFLYWVLWRVRDLHLHWFTL